MRKRANYWDKPLRPKPAPKARGCDWPGCDDTGEHRAPKSRDRLNEYYWFCMDHAREYNASWNYYSGMSETEVEVDRRRDTVWQRPTWRLGTLHPGHGLGSGRVHDGFGYLGEDDPDGTSGPRQVRPMTDQEEAMAILDLRPPLDAALVKARYKELVKRHHPDANGGDKTAEERFKKINQAYQTVMASLTP